MNSQSNALVPNLASESQTHGRLDRFLRRRLLDTLSALRDCELVLVDGDERFVLGQPLAGREPLRAELLVHSPEFYRRLAQGGSVGVGEAWMDGLWSCSDAVTLVRMFVRNRDLLDAMEGGAARVAGWLMRTAHALRRNTRGGSRRNIAEHYDLGNDLFSLFLDENLMYSSALFAHEHEPLEVAATRKLDRICQKLELKPEDHVIEIGTGWGGFALHAARHYGCRVTTTTISQEQHALASRRIAEAGLSDRVTLLLRDYRDLDGRYDKLVSIEMIEAIGHHYLDTYFAKCASLLQPDGLALVQAITIEDHRYQQALHSVDFIKRHIFPGSFIPSVSAMLGAAGRSADFKCTHLEDFGESYAWTLRAWHRRFVEQLQAVRALGYPERFVRMWRWYLAYCEGGFLERAIGVVQMLFAKSGARPQPFLPGLKDSA